MRGVSAPNRVTSSRSRFHFLRQLNGSPQRAHVFNGRSDLAA